MFSEVITMGRKRGRIHIKFPPPKLATDRQVEYIRYLARLAYWSGNGWERGWNRWLLQRYGFTNEYQLTMDQARRVIELLQMKLAGWVEGYLDDSLWAS